MIRFHIHRDDTVSNNEMWSNRRADIENAFVDSCPVKEILGPAVVAPKNKNDKSQCA